MREGEEGGGGVKERQTEADSNIKSTDEGGRGRTGRGIETEIKGKEKQNEWLGEGD